MKMLSLTVSSFLSNSIWSSAEAAAEVAETILAKGSVDVEEVLWHPTEVSESLGNQSSANEGDVSKLQIWKIDIRQCALSSIIWYVIDWLFYPISNVRIDQGVVVGAVEEIECFVNDRTRGTDFHAVALRRHVEDADVGGRVWSSSEAWTEEEGRVRSSTWVLSNSWRSVSSVSWKWMQQL